MRKNSAFIVWLLLLPLLLLPSNQAAAAAAASVAGIHHSSLLSHDRHGRHDVSTMPSSSSLLLRLGRRRRPLQLLQPTEESFSIGSTVEQATRKRRRRDNGGRRRRKSFLVSSSVSSSTYLAPCSSNDNAQQQPQPESFPAVVIRSHRRQQRRRRGPLPTDSTDELAYLTKGSTASSSSSKTVVTASAAAAKTDEPLMTSGAGADSGRPNTGSPVIPNYNDLTLIGKIVAGTVEIGATVIIEYLTGFLGGYFIGCVTDVPRLLFRPVVQEGAAANRLFWKEVWGRTTRMHTKSKHWGTSWGGISAAFGGFRVGVRVIRNKEKDDEWNTIFSSMAAGAFFARTDGINAMIKSAVLYGGLVYILSGNSPIFMSRGGRNNNNRNFDYEEQAIEF